MPVVKREVLKDDIQKGKLSSAYFLYGEESFLVKSYADRIKNKVLSGDDSGINLVEISGNPDFSLLTDHIEAVPFFSDYKVIMVNDFNPESVDENQTEELINILKNMPDTAIIIFYLTGITFSSRTAKVKKLLDEIKKYAVMCEFKPLTSKEVANVITTKVNKEKRRISSANASYLAEITVCDLNLASVETRKLCSYVGEGKEITREIIDKMVEKRLETQVFTLSTAMLANDKQKTFQILNGLFEQRAEPVAVLAALASAYSELYMYKAAINSNVSFNQVAADNKYASTRMYFAQTKYNQAKAIDTHILRKAMGIIYETDTKLKSVKIDGRILLEETVLKLMKLKWN